MPKKICFFTVGFAFNRLVRLKYYEKIFPKDTEIFLFTTNKHKGKVKQDTLSQWDLKRTKIEVAEYNPLRLPFTLRKFLQKNEIGRTMNIGTRFGCIVLLLATLFTTKDYIMNIYGGLSKVTDSIRRAALMDLIRALAFYPLLFFSRKTVFVDYPDYKRFKKDLFFISEDRLKFIPGPVDTTLFKPKNKISSRKKLKLPLDKKIVIYVGRVYPLKCSDMIRKLIERNPDIFFIVIGAKLDAKFPDTAKNMLYIEKKSSKELVDYYNASDLCFFMHRIGGGGIGLIVEEALACGLPVLLPRRDYGVKKSDATIEIDVNFDIAHKAVNDFFQRSIKERERLSVLAREHVLESYAEKALKGKYIEYYLSS